MTCIYSIHAYHSFKFVIPPFVPSVACTRRRGMHTADDFEIQNSPRLTPRSGEVTKRVYQSTKKISLAFALALVFARRKGGERRGKKEEGRRRKKQKRRSSQTVSRADHVLVYIPWLLQWQGFRRLDWAVTGGGGASTVWQHAVCRLGVVDWDLPTRTCRLGVF